MTANKTVRKSVRLGNKKSKSRGVTPSNERKREGKKVVRGGGWAIQCDGCDYWMTAEEAGVVGMNERRVEGMTILCRKCLEGKLEEATEVIKTQENKIKKLVLEVKRREVSLMGGEGGEEGGNAEGNVDCQGEKGGTEGSRREGSVCERSAVNGPRDGPESPLKKLSSLNEVVPIDATELSESQKTLSNKNITMGVSEETKTTKTVVIGGSLTRGWGRDLMEGGAPNVCCWCVPGIDIETATEKAKKSKSELKGGIIFLEAAERSLTDIGTWNARKTLMDAVSEMSRQDNGVVLAVVGIPPTRGRGGKYERARRVFNQVVEKDIQYKQEIEANRNLVFLNMDDCYARRTADRVRKVRKKLQESERGLRERDEGRGRREENREGGDSSENGRMEENQIDNARIVEKQLRELRRHSEIRDKNSYAGRVKGSPSITRETNTLSEGEGEKHEEEERGEREEERRKLVSVQDAVTTEIPAVGGVGRAQAEAENSANEEKERIETEESSKMENNEQEERREREDQ